MPAFSADGTVTCPFQAAWLEFYNADKNMWTANVYKTPECKAAREFSHGSLVSVQEDGSFPPVFLWGEINYRVIAKGFDGSMLATIERVTPDAEWELVAPAVVEAPADPEPAVELVSELDALKDENAELKAELERLRAADAHNFPENLTDKLSDWDTVPDEASQTEPVEPDLNVIPEQLAAFAQADETADDFRIRLKQLWQRFGIDDGEHFVGGGEPLTGEEKIAMREIDILLNSDEGQNAGLLKWLYPDGATT